MKSNCKMLILCGGKGKRLGKLGSEVPKALINLQGEPILFHKLKDSIKQGFYDFIIAIGYKGNLIIEKCNKEKFNANIVFSDAGENAGMLNRIIEASRDFSEDRTIVTYGDSFSNLQWQSLIDFHIEKKSLLTLVTSPIQSPFGLITSNDNKQVLSLEEKPILHYYVGSFIIENKALDFVSDDLKNWADGEGLIAFFKILMAIKKLFTYVHEGADLTFNTVEELKVAEEGFLKFYTHFNSK